jgi:hypothetical protein
MNAAMTTGRRPALDFLVNLPCLLEVSGPAGEPFDRVPIDTVTTADDGTIHVAGRGTHFSASARWQPIEVDDGWLVTVDGALEGGGAPVDAAVSVALRVPADQDPRWLVPGVFYGENRPVASRARYPRWVADPAAATGDPFASEGWWLRSDRAATPAVLASGQGLRIALATTEESRVGPTGVGFGTMQDDAEEHREIRLSFPYREEPVVYDGSPQPLPPDRRTHRWIPGTTVRLSFRAFLLPDGPDADRMILRDLRDWLAPKRELQPSIGVDEAASLAAEGLLRWHFRPSDAALIETADFDREADAAEGAEPGNAPGDRLAMHVAWLSGAPAAASLLVHGRRVGRAEAIDAATLVLDSIATNLAPCGTFWDQWTATAGWGKGWTPGPDAVHGRTLAEATLFMIRAASLLPRSLWRDAVASNVAYITDQERDGVVPADWNGRTGDPLSFAGTSALAWVPALVEAAGLLRDPKLVDVARRIGARRAEDVDAGFLCGAPEDVDLGPTSEDGYVAVQAYVALARTATSGDDRWLELARRSADWMLTFRFTYDVAFPPDSPLGQIGFRSRGADLASPANQHLHAYGLICTGELAELSRRSGDGHYVERARETLGCFRQVIARADGELGGRRGMMPERFYQTRYDGQKGDVGRLSHAWCLGLLLHAAEFAVADPDLAADAEVAAGG